MPFALHSLCRWVLHQAARGLHMCSGRRCCSFLEVSEAASKLDQTHSDADSSILVQAFNGDSDPIAGPTSACYLTHL